jgi:hypothetical protein
LLTIKTIKFSKKNFILNNIADKNTWGPYSGRKM